ncbi:MAG: hypothetical protein KA275_03790, partial [Chitinophagaceae bacterium]|nr:hypothetical protein [Chitinophagaceae bacterium]
MKNKKFIQQLLITFLILKTVTGFAKENKNQYFKLNEFYKTSKFLKNNTCIIQDNNNIYWAATKDNIFFFNGNYFQPINLKITNCKDLFFDSKNNLWANTKNGYQLIENIYSTPNFSKKINTKNISSATPYKNNIWYFENEIGLVNYDIIKQTKKIIKFPKNSSIYKEKIIKIIIQENKIIALSSIGNILVYNTLSNSFYIAMLSASKK